MDLTEEQKQAVTRWIEESATLADVQKRLKEEFGLSLTYLDTRFLVDDLKLTLKEEPKAAPSPLDAHPPAAGAPEAVSAAGAAPPPGAGKVQVTMDELSKPNALVSGKVTFSDGQRAEWYLDNLGRLGLHPDTPGYRPAESDVIAFQSEMQRLARSSGF
jgi:hypothetical protein